MGLLSQRRAPSCRGAIALDWAAIQLNNSFPETLRIFRSCTKPALINSLSSPCSQVHCGHHLPLPRFFGSFLLNLSCVSVSLYFHKFWLLRTSFNSDCDKLWNRRFCELGALVCCCLLCCWLLHCNLHFPFPPSLPLQPHTPLTPSDLTIPLPPPPDKTSVVSTQNWASHNHISVNLHRQDWPVLPSVQAVSLQYTPRFSGALKSLNITIFISYSHQVLELSSTINSSTEVNHSSSVDHYLTGKEGTRMKLFGRNTWKCGQLPSRRVWLKFRFHQPLIHPPAFIQTKQNGNFFLRKGVISVESLENWFQKTIWFSSRRKQFGCEMMLLLTFSESKRCTVYTVCVTKIPFITKANP